MARRSEHSLEQIKEMVLTSAEAIVIEDGFAGLTMRKIAVDIGYTVGSIYMVFDNVSDLILHINARTLDELARDLEQAPEGRPECCIEALARLYFRYAQTHYNRWSLIFEHRPAKGIPLPDWYQDKVDRVFSRFQAEFSRLEPSLAELDVKQAALALWGGIHGIAMLALTGKLAIVGVDDAEASIVLLVRNFISGWQSPQLS